MLIVTAVLMGVLGAVIIIKIADSIPLRVIEGIQLGIGLALIFSLVHSYIN